MPRKDSRFDKRSKAEFIKDIQKGHIYEAEIAIRLCILEKNISGFWPLLLPTGVDNSGHFIKDIRKVTCDPDFTINNTPVEITRSDGFCNHSFHLKVHKVKNCIKENIDCVFVNGFKAFPIPLFVRLDPITLARLTKQANKRYGEVWHPGKSKSGFIKKPAYRYNLSWMRDLWTPLPPLIADIPLDYLDILGMFKL